MKFAALISGGKDSILALHMAVILGHEVVALAHLTPREGQDETDSYMYQSVGSNVIAALARSAFPDVAYFSEAIIGTAVDVASNEYEPTADDEVEDLYRLCLRMREAMPEIQGVITGAIFSTYQKRRVESICRRLGWVSYAPLWHWPQHVLLAHLTHFWGLVDFDVRVIKTATIGLGDRHLMRSLAELEGELLRLYQKYEINVCGEGGEFESLVLSAPGFAAGLAIHSWERRHDVEQHTDMVDRVSYCVVTKSSPEHVLAGDGGEIRVATLADRIRRHPKSKTIAALAASYQVYMGLMGLMPAEFTRLASKLAGLVEPEELFVFPTSSQNYTPLTSTLMLRCGRVQSVPAGRIAAESVSLLGGASGGASSFMATPASTADEGTRVRIVIEDKFGWVPHVAEHLTPAQLAAKQHTSLPFSIAATLELLFAAFAVWQEIDCNYYNVLAAHEGEEVTLRFHVEHNLPVDKSSEEAVQNATLEQWINDVLAAFELGCARCEWDRWQQSGLVGEMPEESAALYERVAAQAERHKMRWKLVVAGIKASSDRLPGACWFRLSECEAVTQPCATKEIAPRSSRSIHVHDENVFPHGSLY